MRHRGGDKADSPVCPPRHTGGIGACARQHAVAAPARPQPSISAVGGAVIRPVSRIRVWFGAPRE